MTGKKNFSVKFLPSKKIIKVPEGYNLKQAILDCGIDIESSCGGVGTCGRCKVQVISGKVYSEKSKFISEKKKKEGFVLSCLSKVVSDIVVLVPESRKVKARIEEGEFKKGRDKIYSGVDKDELAEVEIKPWIIKKRINVRKPTLDHNPSDLYRVKKSLKENLNLNNVHFPISVIRKLPYILREGNWEVTVTVDKSTAALTNIQPGNNEKNCYGIALDIGTTTLTMYLINMITGRVIGSTSEYNSQIKFGEDVISRVVYSIKNNGLSKLREVVVNSINNMIAKLLSDLNIEGEDVTAMMVSGNSIMIHIFYGVSPKYIREAPYVTVTNKFSGTTTSELGLEYIKNAVVYSIEGVASYLGGDITSGVLAINMANREKLALFLDLGTNGELVLGNRDWMIGCSCSAGPAFEGGGVKCGIRAIDGAIEKVVIDQNSYKCYISVIGEEKPVGICGSGLIDLISELYLKGAIDRRGKLNKDIGNPYLKCIDNEYRYIIVDHKDSATGEDIYINEVDINNMIRAKAAVYAGIKTLLEEIDLKVNDIDKVFIAGGLGKNINIQSAIIIGMLPDIDIKKYSFLGNTSIMGAYLCLLSENKFKQSDEIANKITYMELSVNNKFMDRFIAGLFLPYTDLREFPTAESFFYSQ